MSNYLPLFTPDLQKFIVSSLVYAIACLFTILLFTFLQYRTLKNIIEMKVEAMLEEMTFDPMTETFTCGQRDDQSKHVPMPTQPKHNSARQPNHHTLNGV